MTSPRAVPSPGSLAAVVTGATRGVGLAAARALADHGANVVINGRTEEACREAIAAIGPSRGEVSYLAGDIADEAVAEALVDHCMESFGHVDFVLNNAGFTRDKSLMNMTVDEFDDVVRVHLRGSWLACRAAARAMRHSGGSILNVTSGSALYGLVGQSNYAAAKGGVIALTRALSVELSRYRIRVNALYPIALTDMTAPVLDLSGEPDDPLRSMFGDPAAVARIVMALAHPGTPVTGQILSFDGTVLSVWSHPDELYRIRHPAPWTASALESALTEVAGRPAVLHPDAVGVATRKALQRLR